jgi:hypothetical protein
MYAEFMGGVTLDFALNMRKSPVSLAQVQQEVRRAPNGLATAA